jgi:hypothetical protein
LAASPPCDRFGIAFCASTHATAQMVRKYIEKKRRAKVGIGRLNQARGGTKED